MNSSNETFYSLDFWFTFYGYSNTLDLITAYAITPIWFLSLIFSIFSLLILSKPPFLSSKFFRYMRLYVANCLVLSLLCTTSLATTRRYFNFTNTYESTFYTNYVFISSENILFLFSSSIEVCLVIERIIHLLPTGSIRRLPSINFNKIIFILFFIIILVNLPPIFLFEPAFADVQSDQNTTFRIWYIGLTSFSFSLTGQILNYFVYFFRDILPLLFKIFLNSLLIYLVRKYVKNKQITTGLPTIANSNLLNFDRKQTYIALLMNILSLLEHFLYILNYVFFFLLYFELSNLVYIFAVLFIAIKHLLSFFILYILNSLFRNEVNHFFKCSVLH